MGAIMNLKQARQKTSTACFFIKLGKHCGLAVAAALTSDPYNIHK